MRSDGGFVGVQGLKPAMWDTGDVQRGMEGDSFGMGSAEEGFKFPWQKE